MKKLLIILSLIAICVTAQAQENPTGTPYKNEFGFHAGLVTGIGLSYRYWIDNAGFQITAMPPIVKDDFELYSFGLTYLQNFKDKRWMRVFGYAGVHYLNKSEQIENYEYDPITGTYLSNFDRDELEAINVGFGPGVSFGTKVRISLMIGYGFHDILGDLDMYPTGEIGLYYNF